MSPKRRSLVSLFILGLLPVAVAVMLAACEGGSGSYNELNSLRVLGLRADPPTLPPADQGSPTTTLLTPLVYQPDDAAPTYSWSWCPLRGGIAHEYQCAIGEADLLSILAGKGIETNGLSYDLGTAPTAVFESRLSPAVLSELCQTPLGPQGADVSGIPDCSQGFPISIGFTVRAGSEEVKAFKGIHLALSQDQTLNANPSLEGLAIAREGGSRQESVELVDDSQSFEVSLGHTYELFAEVEESAAEHFLAPKQFGGEPIEQREKLVMTWFAEAGEMAAGSTSYYEGVAELDVLERNTWDLPKSLQRRSDSLRIYVVLHDTRGGMQWLMRTVRVAR